MAAILALLLAGCGQSPPVTESSPASSESGEAEGSSEAPDVPTDAEASSATSASTVPTELPSSSEEASSAVEIPPAEAPANPGPDTSSTATDYDPMYTVPLRIVAVDAAGKPVANLCINLEYTGGQEGTYMPGDAMTKSDGTVLREAHPNANYNVLVSDRKQLDYEGKTLRNQMSFPIRVEDGAENNFQLVWTYPSPRELDLADPDKITLTFRDQSGNPVQDLWVTGSPAEDNNPEPRQLVFGITDQDGRVYWTSPEYGSFKMSALLFLDEEESQNQAGSYTFTSETPGQELFFSWNPQ